MTDKNEDKVLDNAVLETESDNFIAGVKNEGDTQTIIHATDVEPYLKAAKAQRHANFHDNQGYSKDRGMRKVASIPPLMVQQLLREDPDIFDNPKRLLKKIKKWKSQGLDFTVVDKL